MAKHRGSPRRAAIPRVDQNKIHKKVNPHNSHFQKGKNRRFPTSNFQEPNAEIIKEFNLKNKTKNTRHQKSPKKKTKGLEFRFGDSDKSLPSNVLAFVANATAESDNESIIEEFPTVTIEDDNDEPIPGPSTAKLPIISEKSDPNESDNESDIIVIKVKSNKSRTVDSQNLMIEKEVLSVEFGSGQNPTSSREGSTRIRENFIQSSYNLGKSDQYPIKPGCNFTNSYQNSVESVRNFSQFRGNLLDSTYTDTISCRKVTETSQNLIEPYQSSPESDGTADVVSIDNTNRPSFRAFLDRNMDGRLHIVQRFWKKKCVKYPDPLVPRGPYLDSLSQAIADSLKKYFRSLYNVTSLPPEGMINDRIFRFISYNVLCQRSMDDNPQLYEHLANYAPGCGGVEMWNERWKLLKDELRNLQGDIYCLQEVEAEFLENYFLSFFKPMGFQGVYTQRDGRADGCAIFWRVSKFTLIESVQINLNYNVDGLDKPNVGQIVILRHNFTKKELIVVNTHILFSPLRGDVKLNQLMVIFARLGTIRSNQHVIFAGDLNIEPHSQLYNFIRFGSLEIKADRPPPCTGSLSGQKYGRSKGRMLKSFLIPEIANINFDCSTKPENSEPIMAYRVTHPFRFANVYDHVTNRGQREVSTYHMDIGNPDHIFYTAEKVITRRDDTFEVREKGLHLIRRLTLPDIQKFQEVSGPLPNHGAGSDHIPLLADFSIF